VLPVKLTLSREADLVHTRVGDHVLALHGIGGEHADDALGNGRFGHGLGEDMAGEGVLHRHLDDDRAAGHEGGCDLLGGQRERAVPGGNGHDDADGFADDQGAGRSVDPLLLEDVSLGQLRVEAQVVGGGDGEVPLGEAARAAGLGHGQTGEFGRARVEAVGQVAQGRGALLDAPPRPGAGVERLPGRGHGGVDVRRRGQGDVADDLLGAG
jgi:hypothetical protein